MRSGLEYIPMWVRYVAVALVAAQIVLSLGYLAHAAGLRGTLQFDMDSELNLPAWWSSTILVATAIVCVGLWWTATRLGRPGLPWLVVALGFLGLSAEEIAAIHEDIGAAAGGGADNVSVWPLVYAPIAAFGVWMLWRAIRDLPRPLAVIGVVGLVSYIAVLGIEVLALAVESHATVLLEENLEMLGTGLMLCALASEFTARFVALFPEAATAPTPATSGERAHLIPYT